MISMFFVGRLVGKVDPRLLLLSGLGMAAFSLWEMTGFNANTGVWDIVRTGVVDEGAEKDYYRYLKRSMEVEARTLDAFFQDLERTEGQLPTIPNTKTQRPYDRTPDLKALRLLKKKGIRL